MHCCYSVTCSGLVNCHYDIKPRIWYLSQYVVDEEEGLNFAPNMNLQSVLALWKEVEYYRQYQQQLRDYLGNEKANEVLEEAVYLISIGTNDFLENYYTRPGRSSQFSVEEYQNFLTQIAKDFVTNLYNLGARKISLGGLPPMGCLPLERTTNIWLGRQCIEEYNQVAKQFNGKLTDLVGELNGKLKGLQLVFSNPYEILLEMIQKPSYFGKISIPKSHVKYHEKCEPI